ncbi:MAG: hypothetical protein EB075_10270, partial [Bacteroidetes bacterium]|nr:hypothetical protein [Bacteroidota bacterium]
DSINVNVDMADLRFYESEIHNNELNELYEKLILKKHTTRFNTTVTNLSRIQLYLQNANVKGIEKMSSSENQNFDTDVRMFNEYAPVILHEKSGTNFDTAMNIISTYEKSTYGPLFSTSVQTIDDKCFAPSLHSAGRTSQHDSHRIYRRMHLFEQTVFDSGIHYATPFRYFWYSSDFHVPFTSLHWNSNLLKQKIQNAKLNSADAFPGKCSANPVHSMEIILKTRRLYTPGILGNYATEYSIRCTGMWVKAGTISTVTLHDKLINKGYHVMVGCHHNDPSLIETGHPTGRITRMDRMCTYFHVDRPQIEVHNPYGGAIYLLVPYQVDDGLTTLKATNVVPAPLYRDITYDSTRFQTTEQEWDSVPMYQDGGAPWVDIETDYTNLHIPSVWLHALVNKHNWLGKYTRANTLYKRVQLLADQWTAMIRGDGILRDLERPLGKRDHPLMYVTIDTTPRTGAGGVGWPMSNGPIYSYDNPTDRANYWFTNNPIDDYVTWHEYGHGQFNFIRFREELESANELCIFYIAHQVQGLSFNEAYKKTNTFNSMNDALMDWLKEDIFHNGNLMYYRMAGYQPRSWHKYADIVHLFGWNALHRHFKFQNEKYEAAIVGKPKIRYDHYLPQHTEAGDRTLLFEMSTVIGADLAPLMDFWGVTSTSTSPSDQNAYQSAVRVLIDKAIADKVQSQPTIHGASTTVPIHKCRGVYHMLKYFRSMIPKDDTELKQLMVRMFGSEVSVNADGTINWRSGQTNGGTPYKYLGWYYHFYEEQKRSWDATMVKRAQDRIDAVLKLHFNNDVEPSTTPNCIGCNA